MWNIRILPNWVRFNLIIDKDRNEANDVSVETAGSCCGFIIDEF